RSRAEFGPRGRAVLRCLSGPQAERERRRGGFIRALRSEEHTSALQANRDLPSLPTRRSSDLVPAPSLDHEDVPFCDVCPVPRLNENVVEAASSALLDRKSTRLHSRPTEISPLSLHDALPISFPRRVWTTRTCRSAMSVRSPG